MRDFLVIKLLFLHHILTVFILYKLKSK